ncbi:MAG: hypothetical protein GY765_39640, partial [bacterium]|nr:hypothetical protein [bacterium]
IGKQTFGNTAQSTGTETKHHGREAEGYGGTYRAYGNGESIPSTTNLATLAATTNASPDWLITGKGEMFFRHPRGTVGIGLKSGKFRVPFHRVDFQLFCPFFPK